jgi:hypothetical protein
MHLKIMRNAYTYMFLLCTVLANFPYFKNNESRHVRCARFLCVYVSLHLNLFTAETNLY